MPGFDPESEEKMTYQKIQSILNPISEEITSKIGDLIEEMHNKHGEDIGFDTLICVAQRALLGMKCTYMCHMDMIAKQEVEEEEAEEEDWGLGNVDFSDN